jgi:hypothetical protein
MKLAEVDVELFRLALEIIMNLPDATRMKYVELVRREVWKLLPYWM